MRCIPPSVGFRFPFSRKLSWLLKWNFQSPSPSWHPYQSISVIISRYGTQSVGELFIASHGYQERFAELSSVVPHMPLLITSFPCKSKSASSKTAAALRPNFLPGVFFPQHLHPAGCCFCCLWEPRDCPYLPVIPLPEISVSLDAEWSVNPLLHFWIRLLKGQSWPYQNHLLFSYWLAEHTVRFALMVDFSAA